MNDRFNGSCSKPVIKLISPVEVSTVSQHNDLHKAFLFMPHEERIAYFADADKRVEMKSAGWFPVPVRFSWSDSSKNAGRYRILLSLYDNFHESIQLETDRQEAEFDNLHIGARYYWKVIRVQGDQELESETGSFQTEDLTPRMLRVEGVPNVRDMGGYRTSSGKRVRQGLVYRSAGLNGNAQNIFYRADEIKNSPDLSAEYNKQKAADEHLLKVIDDLQKRLTKSGFDDLVPYNLTAEWTVFRPDEGNSDYLGSYAELDDLTEIPDTWMGAEAEKISMDADGRFRFKETIHYAPAVFMQEFESDRDGFMQIGCGADWYWDLRINSEKLFDQIGGGSKTVVGADNYLLEIPVKAGKNLIIAFVRSGIGSWSWCCARPPAMSRQEILLRMIQQLEEERDKLWSIVKESIPGEIRLTDESRQYLVDVLGIKSDLDLRRDSECHGMDGSPLGKEVTWFQYSSGSYGGMREPQAREAFAKSFRVFLNPRNYPIIYHCAAGQDRTGAVAFIIHALLGVDLKDLYLDWEVTGFWNLNVAFRHDKAFDYLVAMFQERAGQDMYEKVLGYVLELGFTMEDIATLRSIMLE